MITAKILRKAIEYTSFATTSPATSALLAGIRFEIEPGRLRTVATDGHRLAVFEADCSASQPMEFSVGRKNLDDLVDFLYLNANDAPVTIQATDDSAVIVEATNGKTIHLPIITGQFPNWCSVIPPDDKCIRVRLDRTAFQNALAQVRRQTTRRDRRIAVWFLKDVAVLSAVFSQTPSTVRVPAQSTKFDHGVVNADFLRDALKTFPAGEIELRFECCAGIPGIVRPIELVSAEAKPSKWFVRQLIMPCYPGVSSSPPEN